MLCPNCQVELKMSERERIEIDYCPQCRGVWLDRGELDKIIERSAEIEESRQRVEASHQRPDESRRDDRRPYDSDRRYDDDRKYSDHKYYGGGHKHYKKKSFLGELLDF